MKSFRSYVIALLALVLTVPCLADSVGRDAAIAIAGRFLRAGGSKTPDRDLCVFRDLPATKAPEDIPFFIIEDPSGGFVIVSNETALLPVLAYSYDSRLLTAGNIPPPVKAWFDALGEAVRDARSGGVATSPEVKQAWERALASTKAYTPAEPVVELETAQWHQYEPFNSLCPTIGGSPALTGCMPLATAIIMRYWEWPRVAPNVYIKAYYSDGVDWIPEDSSRPHSGPEWVKYGGWTIDYPYDWGNMPLTDGSGFSGAQSMAVGTLIRDIGAMEQASYGLESTGAAPEAASALRYLGYDNGLQYFESRYLSNQEWIRMIAEEIRAGRPVLMGGSGYYSGSHAFVADAIDSNDYVRLNWGWGGSFNGYYSLAPFGYESDTRSPSYFFTMGAWVGIQPDTGNPERPPFYCGQMGVKGRRINAGEKFTVVCERIYPLSQPLLQRRDAEGFSQVFFTVAHCDRNGNIKDVLAPAQSFYADRFDFEFPCDGPEDIEYGDYLCVCYRYEASDAGEWKEALHDVERALGFIPLKEKRPLPDVTRTYITRVEHLEKFRALYKDSKILRITTRRGTSIELYDGDGRLIQRDNVGYSKFCIWIGDYVTPGEMVFNIYLSDLSAGIYRVALMGPLEEFVFTFEI